jgi:hypothetical protein
MVDPRVTISCNTKIVIDDLNHWMITGTLFDFGDLDLSFWGSHRLQMPQALSPSVCQELIRRADEEVADLSGVVKRRGAVGMIDR